jgi:hypothetical protein
MDINGYRSDTDTDLGREKQIGPRHSDGKSK